MKKRLPILGLLICAVLLLQGCQPPFIVRLYNNTGVDVPVRLVDEVWNWQNGAVLRIENETVTLEGGREKAGLEDLYWRELDRPLLQINYKSNVLVFDFRTGLVTGATLPDEYDVQAIAGPQYGFQLQPDGMLYAVRRDETFPTANLSPQPRGFPLAPYTPQPD